MSFKKLELKEKGLFVTRKKAFSPLGLFEKETIRETLEFAYAMSFGKIGEHRSYRSGGSHFRKNGEIFSNAFQGKLSEFAFYNQFNNQLDLQYPDLSVYELGKWDDWDFIVCNKKISIKSTKRIGNLLLLETKDWNDSAEYIPNLGKGDSVYDFFFLVSIDPFCESLLKSGRILYSNTEKKETLEKLVYPEKWQYDMPGFVDRTELQSVIDARHIIKKGEKLNGTTKMDADNYYIQSGDMHAIDKFIIALK